MGQFDRKHGITRRRKHWFVTWMLLSIAAGASVNMALIPEFQSAELIESLANALYVLASLFGTCGAFLFFCYKLLSIIDRPHALAALRSILIQPDPYQD